MTRSPRLCPSWTMVRTISALSRRRRARRVHVLQEDALGDLDAHPVSVHSGLPKRERHPLHEVALREPFPGQVDVDAEGQLPGGVAPLLSLPARLAQHPVVEIEDEAGLLGGGDELRGREEAPG